MTNHPNRSRRGRPPLAPEDRKRNITLRLSPAAIEVIERLGTARVDELLRTTAKDA